MQESSIRMIIITAFISGAVAGVIAAPLGVRLFGSEIFRLPSSAQSENSSTYRPVNDTEADTMAVVEKANTAVVSVVISKDLSRQGQLELPLEDFFNFGLPFEAPGEQSPSDDSDSSGEPKFRQVGGGSGFIIESDGLIVTNRHVVLDEAARYTIVLASGKEYEATVLAKDPVLDVALLKIDATDLPTVRLGDSDQIRLGQTVIAIGNALAEFGNTVTQGVVSGIGRRVEAEDGQGQTELLDEAIQTDAAINPGNSGGPLLNLTGEVVGINTAVSGRGQSVGFAIPINSVKKTIDSVREHGRIIRPWLGVRYTPVTPRLADANNLPVTYGALIVRGDAEEELAVVPGSPADKAGLVENDIILEVQGDKLEDKDSLGKLIGKYTVGDSVKLKVLHDGEEKEITVVLTEFPIDQQQQK